MATTKTKPAAPAPTPAPGDTTALKPAPGPPRAATPDRRATISPFAPVVGWMAAWGVAAIAAGCLAVAGVDLGMGLGLVDGAYGVDGLMPGLYLAAVQVGAFLLGGYASARHARAHGLVYAALGWGLAMVATGADTFVADSRNGESVLAPLDIPFWIDNGMTGGIDTWLALGAFALAGLVGALIGGALGTVANRAAKTA
ncbi:MAG: hypothetical protein QOD86_310 [Miltoncostaeaceae bacterium]|nr:hypothetical protein [Miltoncostaeaceae bacterium]